MACWVQRVKQEERDLRSGPAYDPSSEVLHGAEGTGVFLEDA